MGFNSPPDFTGPMSNRSDMSENDKRLAVLQIQKSGIASPSQGEIILILITCNGRLPFTEELMKVYR